MRKTKIICTLGPASETEETIEQLCLAGMNVARFNFSHGTHEWHKTVMDRVKKVREKLDLPIAIMLDTKGPEYRIGTFEHEKIELSDGDRFTFTVDEVTGNQERVSVSFKNLCEELVPGDLIYVNDGIVQFTVDEVCSPDIHCTVIAGGTISNRKSMSFPGKVLHQEFLSEQDKDDLLFGIENEVDFVAASFVSTRADVDTMREFINAHGGGHIGILAKIENQSGVDNIYDICKACGG
ncbi:MAG: pyruvate kinase, partial [Clostridia bacterium]|nr:pyruvate kinase [Clostridia bacterium]